MTGTAVSARHELVKYYDLVRELSWSCWDRLAASGLAPPASNETEMPTVDAFVASEIPRLVFVRDQWLDTRDPECHLRTPRSIIDRERARLPESVSGEDAMTDPDCPCCQMMSDLPGPTFWHYDCSAMDDDFAFDLYCQTRDEWEQDHRSSEEFRRRFEAEMRERQCLGVPDCAPGGDDGASIWSSSYCVGETADVPLGIRLFGLGCHLAELIVQLRGEADRASASAEIQQLINQLNRDFGNLREILNTSGPALADALFNPVIDHFGNTLGDVAMTRPDLGPKCDSLTNSLATLLDGPPPEPVEESFDPPSR